MSCHNSYYRQIFMSSKQEDGPDMMIELPRGFFHKRLRYYTNRFMRNLDILYVYVYIYLVIFIYIQLIALYLRPTHHLHLYRVHHLHLHLAHHLHLRQTHVSPFHHPRTQWDTSQIKQWSKWWYHISSLDIFCPSMPTRNFGTMDM